MCTFELQAGTFIPSQELEASRLLLEGSAWAPPKARPFWQHQQPQNGLLQSEEQQQQQQHQVSEVVQSDPQDVPSAADAERDAASEEDQGQAQYEQDEGQAPVESPDVCEREEDAQAAMTFAVEVEPEATVDEALASEAEETLQEDTEDVSNQFSKQGQPLPPPPDAPVAANASEEDETDQQAGQVALAVLRGVLAEALDPARLSPVVEAWRCLRPGRVPAFAELREAALPGQYASSSKPDDDDAALWGDKSVSQLEHGASSSAANPVDAVLLDNHFQAFAEFVLESAVIGLVGESAAGDWQTM